MSDGVSRDSRVGAGTHFGAVGPGPEAKIDAAVEMTFPASDASAATSAAGQQAEPGALREPIACSMAVRRMVAAGLQAAFAAEGALLDRLGEADPSSPALRDALDRLRADGGEQLVRLQRALAAFGLSADRGVAGAVPPGAGAGPLGDLALAVALRVEGHRALGTYEALEQVAGDTDLTEVAQYTRESAAAKRRTLDELERLCGGGLIEAAVRAGGDPPPDPVLHSVFGA